MLRLILRQPKKGLKMELVADLPADRHLALAPVAAGKNPAQIPGYARGMIERLEDEELEVP